MVVFTCIIVTLLSAAQSTPDSSDNLNRYARLVSTADSLFWVGAIEDVRLYGEKIVSDFPDSSEGYRVLAMYHFLQNDWDESIKQGKNALKLDENSGMAHHWLGRAYGRKAQESSSFRKMFLVGTIKKHFERAVELMPDYVKAHEDLFHFYYQAPGIVGGGKEKALGIMADIERLDPRKAHELRAYVYLDEGKIQYAEDELFAIIAMDSTDVEARWNVAYTLMVHDPLEARRQLRSILRLQPSDSLRVLYQLGKTYIFAGDSLSSAVKAFTRYLSHAPVVAGGPPMAAAYWRRGLAHEKMRAYGRAKSDYEMCLSLEPDYTEGKKALKALRKKMR